MHVTVVHQPPALFERAVALVGGDPAHPPSVTGSSLAELLPDGLVPGRGWPQPDDLVGIATSPGNLLVVVDGAVVGGVGAIGGPDADGVQEIGYGIAPVYRGRGVGTRAVDLLCAQLFADPAVRAISAEMLEANARSWLLVERLGFCREARPERPGHRRYVLRRRADGPVPTRFSAESDHPSGG